MMTQANTKSALAADNGSLVSTLASGQTVSMPGTGSLLIVEQGALQIIDTATQRQLASLDEGAAVLGATHEELSLQASEESVVTTLATSEFFELSSDAAQIRQAAYAIDAGLIALSTQLHSGAGDSADVVTIVAGETCRASATRAAPAAGEVLWINAPEAAAPPMVATLEMPAQVSPDQDITACDTAALLMLPGHRKAIEAAFVSVLGCLKSSDHQDELNIEEKLKVRAQNIAGLEERAFLAVADVLSDDTQSGAFELAVDCPVHQLMAAMGSNGGYAINEAKLADDSDDISRFQAICKTNKLRYRQVTLNADWWLGDHGDFVIVKDGGELAAIMLVNGRYMVFDPSVGVMTRFDPAMADEWTSAGFVIYPPLPDKIESGWDLIKTIAALCRSDLKTLIAFSAIVSLLALAVPIATGFLIGTIIPAQDRLGLVEFGVILTVIAATSFVLSVASQIAITRVELRAGTLIQAGVIDRILRLPATFFRKFSTGDLVQRTLALTRLEQMLTSGLVGGFLSGLFSIVSGALMFFYAPKPAILALGFGAVLVVVSTLMGRAQVRAHRAQLAASGPVSFTMFEMASGVDKLRLSAAEAPLFERWSRAFRAFQKPVLSEKLIATKMDVADGLFVQACTLAVFVYVAMHLDKGAITTPHLVAFISCVVAFLAGLRKLVSTGVHIATLKPIYEYAAPIFQQEVELDAGGIDPGTVKGKINFSNVRFSYADNAPLVLNGLDLDIQAGEYVALVGGSGCGKSTVLRHLLAFETPQFGSVRVDDFDIASLDKQALRRQFGVVMQNAKLTPGTLYDNIVGTNYGITQDAVLRAVEQVGLADDIKDMPMGLQTTLSDSTGGLSGGQVQRVLLAKAIVASPRIVILDEATSALDNRTQAVVTETMQQLEATRIVVAHRLSTIVGVDRIIVLDKGQVLEQGSYDELMAKGGHFAELAKRQLV